MLTPVSSEKTNCPSIRRPSSSKAKSAPAATDGAAGEDLVPVGVEPVQRRGAGAGVGDQEERERADVTGRAKREPGTGAGEVDAVVGAGVWEQPDREDGLAHVTLPLAPIDVMPSGAVQVPVTPSLDLVSR